MHINAHLDIDLVAIDQSNEVSCLLEVTAPADEVQAARPGRTLVIVLDQSGSMDGERIAAARVAMAEVVRRLSAQDRLGIIGFSDDAHLIAPIRSMADHDVPALQHVIASLGTLGSTNLSAGYLMALRETKASLADSGHTSATILMLSDGEANRGVTEPDRLRDLARAAVSDSIVTSTVGLGLGYDETVLGALTRGGNGNHRFAATVDVAAAEISQTVSDLLDVSVLAATLRIVPEGTVIDRITVRHDVPNWADDRGVVIALGDLYAGEQRRILVQLGIDAVRDLGTRVVASLEVQFTAAADLAEHRITLPVAVNVVPGDEARQAIPNPVVEVERLIVEADETKRGAIEALRQFDTEAAKTAIGLAILSLTTKRSEAPPPMAAARLDETIEELTGLQASLEIHEASYNAKLLMESDTAFSQGKASRSRPRKRPSSPTSSAASPVDPASGSVLDWTTDPAAASEADDPGSASGSTEPRAS